MTYSQLWHTLIPLYDEAEAKAIAQMVFDIRYGLSLADVLMGKDRQLSTDDQAELQKISQRLQQHEPVQYVLGIAEFYGRRYAVDRRVLIPRPETAELCQWVIDSQRETPQRPCNILDIGTGSGCIAITLAKEIPTATVAACDISADALCVARDNAERHHASVNFFQADILTCQLSTVNCQLSTINLIISNPPYIINKERARMSDNVLRYEPHQALFVDDSDPLLFYRAIARLGTVLMNGGGLLYFETNPLLADETLQMLSRNGYHDIEIRHDQYGRRRMIRATL